MGQCGGFRRLGGVEQRAAALEAPAHVIQGGGVGGGAAPPRCEVEAGRAPAHPGGGVTYRGQHRTCAAVAGRAGARYECHIPLVTGGGDAGRPRRTVCRLVHPQAGGKDGSLSQFPLGLVDLHPRRAGWDLQRRPGLGHTACRGSRPCGH